MARRLLQAAQAFDVQKVVVTVRVLLKGNEETQDMAAKLKTAVQEGSLVKAIETLGLKVRGCACVARGEGKGGSGRCTSVSSPVESGTDVWRLNSETGADNRHAREGDRVSIGAGHHFQKPRHPHRTGSSGDGAHGYRIDRVPSVV